MTDGPDLQLPSPHPDRDPDRSPPGPSLGVDVGGTKMMAVALDGAGAMVARHKVPTPSGAAAVADGIAAAIDDLVAEVGPPAVVGLGLAGLVDRRGVLRYGPNLPGVLDLDLTAELGRRFGVPVAIANDASCAVVAEHRLGAARGHHDVVLVTQGTGIGGGIIIDDRLVRGANGFAGEPGHLVIDPDGPRCACGTDGCWEAYASGAGLVNLTMGLVRQGRGRAILARAGGDGVLRGEHVAAALAAGDPDAAEVVDRFASWTARGLANLVTLLDPELVVLGGGLSELSSWFLDTVTTRLADAVLGGPHRPPVPVVAATLGPEAGAIGAALLAGDRAAVSTAPGGGTGIGCC